MQKRKALRPNQQTPTAKSGRLAVASKKLKSKEKPSIKVYSSTGRGQQGESVSGGKGK
jgi:hypothetical protein